jgi:fimbrial chaperone protein
VALNSVVSRRLLVGLLCVGLSASALASSLSISPIVATLDEKKHSAALTLKNEGDEAKVIQTELLNWTQENGENVYTPSRDILVNPPIATLQPGQTQVIRIGLNRKVDMAQELAYRLYISEVPPPPKEGFSGLRIALRFGVAVFVSPKAKPIDKLDWQAARNPEGVLLLTLRNSGNRHMRLTSLKVNDPGNGQQLAEWQPSPATLFAGQARQISLPLPPNWQGKQLGLVAGTEDGLTETRIELDQSAR